MKGGQSAGAGPSRRGGRRDAQPVVRAATPDDAAALRDFAERTFREAFGRFNRAADMERYVAEAFSLAQQRVILSDAAADTLLCTVDGTLAGYVELWRSSPPDCVSAKNALEIRRFYVDRPWQGRGVAPSLLSAIREAAQSRGVDRLWLGVWEHNARAQSFYRNAGFVKVGTQEFLLGEDRQTDELMTCAVPALRLRAGEPRAR